MQLLNSFFLLCLKYFKNVDRMFYVSLPLKIKVGVSPFKKDCSICFNESHLQMIKNGFYFILKVLFILKIFKFLSGIFGHVEKATWLES